MLDWSTAHSCPQPKFPQIQQTQGSLGIREFFCRVQLANAQPSRNLNKSQIPHIFNEI
jgi:hypothetical protein